MIPTYNIENYINTCLDSFVIPEILEELEVLIVNDGSQDRSGELAEAYVRRYPQTFRMIKKENGGHGSTINRGLWENILKLWTGMTGWRETLLCV